MLRINGLHMYSEQNSTYLGLLQYKDDNQLNS